MNINDTFPSNYLRASDLRGRTINVTIFHVVMEEVGDGEKPVLYFKGKEKGLVLNKTNANTIGSLWSHETDNWSGKRIAIFPTQTDFQGRQVECIRIKVTKPVGPEPEFIPEPEEPRPETVNADDDTPF